MYQRMILNGESWDVTHLHQAAQTGGIWNRRFNFVHVWGITWYKENKIEIKRCIGYSDHRSNLCMPFLLFFWTRWGIQNTATCVSHILVDIAVKRYQEVGPYLFTFYSVKYSSLWSPDAASYIWNLWSFLLFFLDF